VHSSISPRWQRLTGVRPEEAPAVLWSMLYVIALFLAYYVLRPIRDELGVAQTVVKYMPGARLVRAFSAVDASVVETSASRIGGRIGMPIASDDAEAMRVAADLVRDAGCDPVVVGNLAASASFQPGGPGFRSHLTAPALRQRLGLPSSG